MHWMVLPLRRYFELSGRSRRKEYLLFTLFIILASIVTGVIDVILGYDGEEGGPIGLLTSLALLIPSTTVSVRRLHDIGKSGWWVAAPFALIIPVAFAVLVEGANAQNPSAILIFSVIALLCYAIVWLVWTCSDGEAGENRFGENPKELHVL